MNPFARLSAGCRTAPDRCEALVSSSPTLPKSTGLEYAYLAGAPGPQIETRVGFEVDGVQLKVRLDFGGGFVDWRGWYTNAGQ